MRLDEAEELLALDELDQKLWLALSCPVKGIQFDASTLAFIDQDGDGHVRANELIAAIRWAADLLVDPRLLATGSDGILPEDIRTDHDVGQRLAAAARQVVVDLDLPANARLAVPLMAEAREKQAARLLGAWETACVPVDPWGERTAEAFEALQAVADKIDDFYMRCRLSAFEPRAGESVSVPEDALQAVLGRARVQPEDLEPWPLAHITVSGELPLREALNPAWSARMAAFYEQTVVPALGACTVLDEAGWRALRQRFDGFAAWRAARPEEQAEDPDLRDLERLARYVRDLMTLANNFVSFKDFYTRQGKATFQAGTLYLDGRSCELCVTVIDPAKHAALASLSRICLVYCDCVRGDRKMTIAAAFTAGDSDQLMVGRNGVFYDREEADWDATIVKIIDHPISLRQAFWSPYKRLARLMGDQMQKLAASRAKENEARLTQTAGNALHKPASPVAPAAPAQAAFDVGKFAGIFAALGLAVGAIGTALASVVMGLLSLRWWQIPLAFVGFVIVISGPAVALAWFKLRARNLGPILDANGWAINARACINIPFGTSLTHLAILPPNAERSLSDPYAEKRPSPGTYLVLAILLGVILAVWWVIKLLVG